MGGPFKIDGFAFEQLAILRCDVLTGARLRYSVVP
jgi:hypothetical protein